MKRLLPILLLLLLAQQFLSCNNDAPNELKFYSSFTELQVGQEWLYIKWWKPHSEDIQYSEDTISVSIVAKDDSIITFYETPIRLDSISYWDTVTFKFQIEDSLLRQVGNNHSQVFGIVTNHGGLLPLGHIDSNLVTIDFTSSLFQVGNQIDKYRFIGYADSIDLFSEVYKDVIVFYDATPTFLDGSGHLAVFSQEDGMVATIYFGGDTPIEKYGYRLIK